MLNTNTELIYAHTLTKVSFAKELHKSLNINFTALQSLPTDTCVIGTTKTILAHCESTLLSCSAQ